MPTPRDPNRAPYVPPDNYAGPRLLIQRPGAIVFQTPWLFSPRSYRNLVLGHEARGGSDVWNCYLYPYMNMFQVHHAPTGYENYRMSLVRGVETDYYMTAGLVVERDLGRLAVIQEQEPAKVPDDAVITSFFALLLREVLDAEPVRF